LVDAPLPTNATGRHGDVNVEAMRYQPRELFQVGVYLGLWPSRVDADSLLQGANRRKRTFANFHPFKSWAAV